MYIDALPIATEVSSADLIIVGQGGSHGVPATAIARQAFLSQLIGAPGPTGPAGPTGPTGPAGTVSAGASVVLITTGASYACDGTERYIVVRKTTGSNTNISLPTSPVTGQVVSVKDGYGSAALYNIVISTTSEIDGQVNAVINQPYQAIAFVYDGALWNII